MHWLIWVFRIVVGLLALVGLAALLYFWFMVKMSKM